MVIEGLHYSPKCFCKNCKEIERRNNISNYMTSLQNESECCEKCDCEGFACGAGLGHKPHCKSPTCPCHSLQKESEWEKMTHKDWFPVVGGGPECENCGAHGYEKYDICPVAVDEAINTAVSNREKEIVEEVRKEIMWKMKEAVLPELRGSDRRCCDAGNGLTRIWKAVLSI